MKFWLGTHMTEWVGRLRIPLFVSAIQLRRRPIVRRARCEWALDSGGFTELTRHGRWTVPPEQYVEEARAWSEAIGRLQWLAVQDWMCEPFVLQKTGLTIAAHQRLTVESWFRLNELAPELPWVPVLQGWGYDDYWQHVRFYEDAGVNLRSLPLVGIGSVCRRQSTKMAEELIRHLSGYGVKLHGFGFKVLGLRQCGRYLASADSLAWSFRARKEGAPLTPICTHKTCANCPLWAVEWRRRLLRQGFNAKPDPGLFDEVPGHA